MCTPNEKDVEHLDLLLQNNHTLMAMNLNGNVAMETQPWQRIEAMLKFNARSSHPFLSITTH